MKKSIKQRILPLLLLSLMTLLTAAISPTYISVSAKDSYWASDKGTNAVDMTNLPKVTVKSKFTRPDIIGFTFDEKENVDGYCVIVSADKNFKNGKTYTNKKTSFTISGLEANTVYYVKATTYVDKGGKRYYSVPKKFFLTTANVKSPSIHSLSSTYFTVSGKMSKVNGATGYVIYLSDNKSFKNSTIIRTKSPSFTRACLKQNTTYYVKAFSYISSNGINHWSKPVVKTIKTKAVPTAAVKYKSSTKSLISLTFNKKQVDGYCIWVADNKDYNGHKTYVSSSPSFNIGSLRPGTTYYIKACGYVIRNGKRYYSNANEFTVSTQTQPKVTYINGILVVNKTYSLPENYDPGVNSQAQKAFNDMAAAAAKDGISLYVVSGYRSYSYQKQLYNNYVYYNGIEATDRFSARPGHSEHQTGLAFDVNNASSDFENTPEAKWLKEHCVEYGFIIRYPQNKEKVTGFKYEPWHIRYLGKEKAKAVYNSGLCLEEYLGIISVYQ